MWKTASEVNKMNNKKMCAEEKFGMIAGPLLALIVLWLVITIINFACAKSRIDEHFRQMARSVPLEVSRFFEHQNGR
jgi:hypothetical protein